MGSEQSKSNTASEVEEILRQHKLRYEAINRRQANNDSSFLQPHTPTRPTLNNIAATSRPSPATSHPSPAPSRPNPTTSYASPATSYASPASAHVSPATSASSLERNRAPYSYSGENLQNTTHINSHLYPELRDDNRASCTTNNNICDRNQASTSRNGVGHQGFVTDNNNHTQAQRLQPSAPLLSDLTEAGAGTVRNNNRSRPRSVSRTRPKPDNHNLRSRPKSDNPLNCPTCGNQFGTTIYQCKEGHSACEGCKNRGALCAKCSNSNPVTSLRNHAVEDYVATIKVPCPNSKQGCCLHFKQVDLPEHLGECPYGDIVCPLGTVTGKCSWRGKVSQMPVHFNEVHPINCNGNVDKEMSISNICNNIRIAHFVQLGAYNFLIHVIVDEASRSIYMTVQFLGTKVSASKWSYEFHIYNKREPRRKYEFSDVCHSNSISLDDIMREQNCAVIPLPYAMSFYNEGCLLYKFFIKNDNVRRNIGYNRGRGAWRGGRGRPM